MGYQQGLSGLSAASSDLDVIGNNIANANTTGFKSGAAQFADMYANSVATAVNNQIGIGTQLSEVQQQFSQGTITSTNQALDVAINGNGFFQLSNNGSLVYSRNGVFQLDKNGNITNAQGLQLMGYAANSSGVINTAQTVPLSVPTANIAPQATTKIVAGLNLNAQDPLMLGTPAVTPALGAGSSLTTTGATITNTASGTNNDSYSVAFNTTTTPPTYTVTDSTLNTTTAAATYTAGTAIQLGNGQTITFNGTPANGDTVAIAPTPIRSTRPAIRRTTTRPARRSTIRSAARRRSTCTLPRPRPVRGTCTQVRPPARRTWSGRRTSIRRARCSARPRS
jgi:flagellar hook protein FlgE